MVVQYRCNLTALDSFHPPGIAVLKPNPSPGRPPFKLEEVHVPDPSTYLYTESYSLVVVLDANGDGYDDATVYTPEVMSMELTYGDLLLFINTAGARSATFTAEEGYLHILLDNQHLSWGLSKIQLDQDPEPEISLCSLQKIPHWCPLRPGAKYAYACDVTELLKASTKHGQRPGRGEEGGWQPRENNLLGENTPPWTIRITGVEETALQPVKPLSSLATEPARFACSPP